MLRRWLQPKTSVVGPATTLVPRTNAKPVTLLTGFLGSGKTSLLNEFLRDPQMRDTAVVINEFGSLSVDHDLVHTGREQYVVTSSGCLCCTATSDIRTSLFELQELASRAAIPGFTRVIVETTGLADPAPIVNSLIPGGAPASGLRDHAVARSFRLAGVVATLDAVSGERNLDEHLECWKQIAFADHIVLTKSDLCEEAHDQWRARLGSINPSARLHDRHASGFAVTALIETASYNPTNKAEDVLGWLAMESLDGGTGHRHTHDPDRHGDRVQALALVHDEPLDPGAVETFLAIITGHRHAGLLRLKGLVALTDEPSAPVVIHAVQNKLYPSARLAFWPSGDVRSRIMVIGQNLALEPIQDLFELLVRQSSQPKMRRA
jgi:G3E family GTPase